MMKKITAAILFAAMMTCLLCSCAKNPSSPLQIGETAIDAETFTYFLDASFAGKMNREARIGDAVQRCVRYVAVNTMFAEYGLSLTDDEIATATEEAGTLWNMFGKYYKSEGVSKATFVRIHIADKYREKLRAAIYGKGGSEEIGDAYLRGALKEYFVSYKTITVPLYANNMYGNRVDFTPEEAEKLRHVMSDGASALRDGQNIEAVASKISVDYPLAEYSYSTIVYGPDSLGITREFIDAVRAMDEGTAGTIEMDGSVYIVYRTDVLADVNIFEDNRAQCLEILSEQPLEARITEKCALLTAVRDNSAISDCLDRVEDTKKDFRDQ